MEQTSVNLSGYESVKAFSVVFDTYIETVEVMWHFGDSTSIIRLPLEQVIVIKGVVYIPVNAKKEAEKITLSEILSRPEEIRFYEPY